MCRILLIDDDEPFRVMLHQLLVELGHTVAEARHGREGLRLHEQTEFDLVITDLFMPEKEGMEVILDLLNRAPDTRIIAISGGGLTYTGTQLLHVAEKIGARRTLAKPFTRAELSTAIAVALD